MILCCRKNWVFKKLFFDNVPKLYFSRQSPFIPESTDSTCDFVWKTYRELKLHFSIHKLMNWKRHHENAGEVKKATHFFTRAGAYNNVIRICKEHGLEDQLLNVALLSNPRNGHEYFRIKNGQVSIFNQRTTCCIHFGANSYMKASIRPDLGCPNDSYKGTLVHLVINLWLKKLSRRKLEVPETINPFSAHFCSDFFLKLVN